MSANTAQPLERITVAICTRDRPAFLEETVRHILEQEVGCPWELLVIDNGQAHPVDTVIDAMQSDIEIRVALEPQPGIDRARNRALLEARGDVIVFADDDITALPGWLDAYRVEFENPEVGGAGGRIFPMLPDEAERWTRSLSLHIGGPPGRYDYGKIGQDIDLKRQSAPFGGNMALRTEPARQVGGFSENFGYGRRRVPGEDTEIFVRLAATGARLRYSPGATVMHRVPLDKLTMPYFISWWRGLGISRTLVRRSGQYATVASAPMWPMSVIRFLKYSIRRGWHAHLSPRWLRAVQKQQVALGEVLEGLRGLRGNA